MVQITFDNDTPVVDDFEEVEIKLRFAVSTNIDVLEEFTYRLFAEVVESTNIDKEIFMYEVVKPVPPYTNHRPQDERFVTVCTPAYLEELPTEPEEDQPYFRKNFVDLYYRTPMQIEEAKNEIIRRVTKLGESLESLSRLKKYE